MRFDLLSALALTFIALEGCNLSESSKTEDVVENPESIEQSVKAEATRVVDPPNENVSDVQFDEEVSTETLIKLQKAVRKANGKAPIAPIDQAPSGVVMNDKFLRLHLVKFALDGIFAQRASLMPQHNNKFDMVWMLQLTTLMDMMGAWSQLRFNDKELTDNSAEIFRSPEMGNALQLSKDANTRLQKLLQAEKEELDSAQSSPQLLTRTAFEQMQEIIGMFPRSEYAHAGKQWAPGIFSPVIEAICVLIYHIPADDSLRELFLNDLNFVQWQPGSNYADLHTEAQDAPDDALVTPAMLEEIRRRIDAERIGYSHCPAKKFQQILHKGELLSTTLKAIVGNPDMSYRDDL